MAQVPGDRPRPHILVLARNYPNNVLRTLGLWTQRLVIASCRSVVPTVIAPVPYAPPFIPLKAFAPFQGINPRRSEHGFDVFHPRYPLPPGHRLSRFEAGLAWPFVRRLADRLHAEQPFALIHAHFIFPDGVIAARLGRRYGIPVVTSEHAVWRPWLDNSPGVRAQVLQALPSIRMVLPVSASLERNIADAVGNHVSTRILPNVVDETFFKPSETEADWDPNQILFVGLIRRVKGLDILVRAIALLAARRPLLRLLVLGGAFYRQQQLDEADVRRLVAELRLESKIRFAGQADPAEVVAAMRRSAMLVVPSRRETASLVTAEAIASGTPVVATRCGGPEDIVTPENGRLVPLEDPAALADAIDEMLRLRPRFDRHQLHATMVARFGTAVTASRLAAVYGEVLGRDLFVTQRQAL